ncbi:MAG TPA: DnaB-like helicase C-terminal domain-containing protein [Candidatus Acidoferrales bacterium]|nr:DnaB-like helicase C-terminal domain-containing protein [Candidatus Acidoferrales bacterium]
MEEKNLPRSEAEELDLLVGELGAGETVREIAGWRSGFAALDQLVNGFLPGLSLLIGPPACGKTAFAGQLADQVAMLNEVEVVFCALGEHARDLRIRRLARLSGLENRDLRKGKPFVLYRYGVPKGAAPDADLPPSWRKLEVKVREAQGWLSRVYLFEGGDATRAGEIRDYLKRVMERAAAPRLFAVIDDSQRLEARELDFDKRLLATIDQLRDICQEMEVSLLAVWPDLGTRGASAWEWGENTPGASLVMVMTTDPERTKKLAEPNRAVALHVVKNREGERGIVDYDFVPAFSLFREASSTSAR